MLTPVTRREWLSRTACGFGALALADLAHAQAPNPLAPRPPHHPAKAKRVIFLFMQGGVSHVDSYDYKPRLVADDGRQMPFDDARAIANTGARGTNRRVMKPLWEFKQRGQSGLWASELFPHVAQHMDELCVVRSLHTEGVAHGPATLFLHCGSTNFVRPSMGSWVLYGLGSENANLPGFMSIAPSAGNGGPRNYGTAFLPAIFQGTALGRAGGTAAEATIRNLTSPAGQRPPFELLRDLHAEQLRRSPGDAELEAVAASYELAHRMQQNAPDVLDLSKETAETLALYGVNDRATDTFGRQCLMARRLCEAGVRYVQVTYGDNSANPAWDQHSNMPKHADHAKACDKPIAGLLADLKRRGLLEDTIVWWGGEFGRTPFAQDNGTGRDHNPAGFTVWMAGGGLKKGVAFGATDEYGSQAVENKVHMHDLHATILHQLGLDHEKLTFRYSGRNFRLTDVHGRVVREVIA
ncbi:DUF1501 domain-containing protein [Urbifossiella limnaea]|uniref:DUF1501 domain-containing protein n=1 Tax=Urbifossiella limnaea TaxID=2528023 RepID=A0A517XMQ4_9BACT|nr:DUF1501 domain-containing protein [Urbifossiella limnaea]QDU18787.1 hypothetical protein ETAA1_06830 [Urbifossiella limnaea]